MQDTPNRIIVCQWEDANMAGFYWRWEVWVTLRSNGTFSMGAVQESSDPPVGRVPARANLKTGADVLAALVEVYDDAGSYFDASEAELEEIAAKLATLSPTVAREFLDAANVRAQERAEDPQQTDGSGR